METITAIREADMDGALDLTLPPDFYKEDIIPTDLTLKPEATLLEVLMAFEKQGGLRNVISDPVTWQREQRQDRPLLGRE